ncbi:MAG: translation initiation factor IF-2 N-terminal domain-containing protein [Desulfuromonadales bacterium]
MGKTKVHELAQKLGLEDEVLLERLQEAGIDVKSSTGILEEEDLKKFEAASAPVVEKIEEERITPGIIRRRRKEVPKPVTAAEEPVPPESEPAVAAPPSEAPTVEAPEAPPAVSAERVEEPAAKVPEEKAFEEPEEVKAGPREAKPAAPAPPSAKEPAPEKTAAAQAETPPPSPAPAKEPKVEKVTASRAKILGRVQLPQAPSREEPARGERGASRKEGFARPERPSGPRRQAEGPGGQRPAEGRWGAVCSQGSSGREKEEKGEGCRLQ